MCHGELRIDFDGACEKRYRVGLIRVDQLPALAVRLQGLQRGCRSLSQWSVVLPHTCEGLTDAGSEFPCYLIKSPQHLFLAGSLHLLFVNDIARAAIRCAHCQHVLASKVCDRAIENCGATGPYANFTGDFWLETGIHRLAHQLESPQDSLIGNKTQIWKWLGWNALAFPHGPSKARFAVRMAETAKSTGVLSLTKH